MAKKKPMGQWNILPAGQLVALRKQFSASRKFRRGQIMALLSDETEARRHGGIYAVRPIDGPNTEVLQQLPRSAFLPVTAQKQRRQVSQ